VDHPRELTHVSLCAGYGGLDLGLRRAIGSVRTVAFSEIEHHACANLVTKIEAGLLDRAPIWTDLKTFPWGAFRGRVDILSGGFPCQPFSTAGQRAGDSDPRHLWPHITRGIRELGRPALVFFENVDGIISSKLAGSEWADPAGTPVLLHILRELERMGYHATAGVFSAGEIGAPHQRKRVFIMGVRDDLDLAARALVSELLERTGRGDLAAWPAGRGAAQHAWEPPRFTRNSAPALGGDADGSADRLDYGDLCLAVDNRIDELRLLGNGVVPATAERAFRVLWGRVGHAAYRHE